MKRLQKPTHPARYVSPTRQVGPLVRGLIAMGGLLLLLCSTLCSAQTAPHSPFAALIAEYLRRDLNGHSPTPEEIAAMGTLQPTPDAASVQEALPDLLKALGNRDVALHTFALVTLVGLQTSPESKAGAASAAPALPAPRTYSAEMARTLTPQVPAIATHLGSEEQASNRLLAVAILGGFTPDTPPAVYPPLLAFLKREDGIGPVGLAVVADLLQLGPISEDTAATVARYLRRPDQTPETRVDLADLIATSPNQSQPLNKALLLYLNSDDDSLRARLILSLPQLELAPDVFADTEARVQQLAANPNENLQVRNAARSVAPCWTAPRMPSGCPVYP